MLCRTDALLSCFRLRVLELQISGSCKRSWRMFERNVMSDEDGMPESRLQTVYMSNLTQNLE